MPRLIPSSEEVMQMLTRTGAFREGHFVYPSGKHTPHYFQMPLAFRYYDTARVLAVAAQSQVSFGKGDFKRASEDRNHFAGAGRHTRRLRRARSLKRRANLLG
ncbi:MAG: hypothetical protein WKF84_16180 [Pyrinomonadaceae bacterium]